jgi:hypothetical protein
MPEGADRSLTSQVYDHTSSQNIHGIISFLCNWCNTIGMRYDSKRYLDMFARFDHGV